MNKVVTLERLTKFYTDLKEKIKTNYYSKSEVDELMTNVEIDTSTLLDKNTYDADKDGIVDVAKTLSGVSEENLTKMIEMLNLLTKSNPQQYIGTDKNNKFGLHYFPTTDSETGNKIEQRVALNVKSGDTLTIESVADMQDQKAFIQVFKYVEGEEDTISTLKEFNNSNAENFIYNKNNVEFDNSCHIKNEYTLSNTLNDETNFYETKINKSDFINLYGFKSEVNE